MKQLFDQLNVIYPMSQNLQEYLLNQLKYFSVRKRDFLLQEGEICKSICFIEKGLVRCFYNREEKEVSSWFMTEGHFIISVESFFKQKPGYENIQTMENCKLLSINYNELQYIYKNYLEFNFIARVLTENYYALSEQRLYSLRMQRATDRYKFLLVNHPEFIQRVPSKFLSSYLSITEETLSRIKSKL